MLLKKGPKIASERWNKEEKGIVKKKKHLTEDEERTENGWRMTKEGCRYVGGGRTDEVTKKMHRVHYDMV